MAAIFELFGKLILDKSEFDSSISEAEKSGEEFGDKFEGAIEKAKNVLVASGIAIGIGKIGKAFGSALTKTTEYADAVDKGSQALGLSAKAYQEWDYALGMSGSSIDSLGIGVRNLNAWLSNTASDDVSGVFDELGISATDAEGNIRDTADVLNDVIFALASMEQSAQRSDLATKLFGRGSASLNAFFNTGREGLQDLVDEANDLGLIMSDEAVKQGAATNDAMSRLQQTLDRLVINIMEPFLPVVEDIANVLAPVVKDISDLLRRIITPILKIAGIDPEHEEDKRRAEEEAKEREKTAVGGKDLLDAVLDIYSGNARANEVQRIMGERNVGVASAQYFAAKDYLRNAGFDEEAVKSLAQQAYELSYGKTFNTGKKLTWAGGDEDWYNYIATQYAESINSLDEQNADLESSFADLESASDGVASAAENAASAMNSIPSYEYGVDVDVGGGERAPGFAKGLWDVPYDNFPAVLHQGEMVLTKSQANDYRNGEVAGGGVREIIGALNRLDNTMANLRLVVGQKEFGRAVVDYGGNRMNDYIGGADNRLATGYGS